jgi:hypothetical protein
MLLQPLKANKKNKIISGVILVPLCFASLSLPVKAKNQDLKSQEGLPTYRVGGGSRGNCLTNNQQLVALIPETAIAKTTTTSPKLFFYIPETKQKNTVALEFVLRDRQDKLIYETFLKTNEQSGIIAVDLPDSVKATLLKTKENYHWYLSMICNPENRSHDVVVEGWIQRVELEANIKKQLQFSQPLEKAKIYQQQDIWYDALSTLAEEKKNSVLQPQVAMSWNKLLESIGLGNLAQEQFIEPYQVSNSLKDLK